VAIPVLANGVSVQNSIEGHDSIAKGPDDFDELSFVHRSPLLSVSIGLVTDEGRKSGVQLILINPFIL
jgi:hypothetical protein